MLIQPGKPWHVHAKEIIEALDYYGFAEHFGWTDEQVDDLKNNRPEKYSMYKAILKGIGNAENR